MTKDNLSFLMAYCAACFSEEKIEDGESMKVDSNLWRRQIADIVNWVESKNYKVLFKTDEEDRVCFESKTVFINSRNHPETKYYTLLHEAGHLLISQSWKSFDRDMPMYAISADGRCERGKAYIVSLLAEEIEAWKRGRRLANKLNHHINNKKFDHHLTDGVMSYIIWAGDTAKGSLKDDE